MADPCLFISGSRRNVKHDFIINSGYHSAVCSESDLKEVVSRLRDWFRVLHENGNHKRVKIQKPEKNSESNLSMSLTNTATRFTSSAFLFKCSHRVWSRSVTHLQGPSGMDVLPAGHKLWPAAGPVRDQEPVYGQERAVLRRLLQILWYASWQNHNQFWVVHGLPEVHRWALLIQNLLTHSLVLNFQHSFMSIGYIFVPHKKAKSFFVLEWSHILTDKFLFQHFFIRCFKNGQNVTLKVVKTVF